MRKEKIFFVESELSLRDWYNAYFRHGFLRVLSNYYPFMPFNLEWEGLDISLIAHRAFQLNSLDIEVPRNFALEDAWYCLMMRCPKVNCVFLPFEGQPVERAIQTGIKACRPEINIVGVQTGFYNSGQMGWKGV